MSQNTQGLIFLRIMALCESLCRKRIDPSKYSGSEYFIFLVANQVELGLWLGDRVRVRVRD